MGRKPASRLTPRLRTFGYDPYRPRRVAHSTPTEVPQHENFIQTAISIALELREHPALDNCPVVELSRYQIVAFWSSIVVVALNIGHAYQACGLTCPPGRPRKPPAQVRPARHRVSSYFAGRWQGGRCSGAPRLAPSRAGRKQERHDYPNQADLHTRSLTVTIAASHPFSAFRGGHDHLLPLQMLWTILPTRTERNQRLCTRAIHALAKSGAGSPLEIDCHGKREAACLLCQFRGKEASHFAAWPPSLGRRHRFEHRQCRGAVVEGHHQHAKWLCSACDRR